MLVIIFSYNREEMLRSLIGEIRAFDCGLNANIETIIIDDGSKWATDVYDLYGHQLIRTPHEGKKGFWKKWVMAIQLALGSGHEHILFLPDDIKDLNLDAINKFINHDWEHPITESFYGVNVINCGRTECWGPVVRNPQHITIDDIVYREVDFVDCGFLTNRFTLENIDVHEIPHGWFDRADKSSGVGHQLTQSMRMIGAMMMTPNKGWCYHGNHKSQMHGKHREETPLTSK